MEKINVLVAIEDEVFNVYAKRFSGSLSFEASKLRLTITPEGKAS
jgi:hypothetical protein